ncbi:MAG: bacillithiol system redox-active protein YtxJ [Balneolaceae bacterium]
MGILDKLFGGEKAETDFGWDVISTEEEVDEILLASNYKPQVIFKHSTRCATSFFARTSLETFPESEKQNADFYLVDVISNRPVSLYLADKFGVRHESPQLIIIKNGEILWHGSHHEVQVEKLKSFFGEGEEHE